MTEEELAAIEARAEAATQGPWEVTRYSGGLTFNGPPTVYAGTDEEFGEPLSIPSRNNRKNDARFIAHARGDIPALLAEVRRLKRETPPVKPVLPTIVLSAYEFLPGAREDQGTDSTLHLKLIWNQEDREGVWKIILDEDAVSLLLSSCATNLSSFYLTVVPAREPEEWADYDKVERLRADLVHARMWATYWRASFHDADVLLHGQPKESGDEIFTQDSDALDGWSGLFCTSDGWQVGDEVPE